MDIGNFFSKVGSFFQQKDLYRIHRLSYFGAADEEGNVSFALAGPGTSASVLTLETPVSHWEDFVGLDFKYAFTLMKNGAFFLRVAFEDLKRPDHVFTFQFDLQNNEVRKWLLFGYKTVMIKLVNGPNGSLAESVNLSFWDSPQNEIIPEALEATKRVN